MVEYSLIALCLFLLGLKSVLYQRQWAKKLPGVDGEYQRLRIKSKWAFEILEAFIIVGFLLFASEKFGFVLALVFVGACAVLKWVCYNFPVYLKARSDDEWQGFCFAFMQTTFQKLVLFLLLSAVFLSAFLALKSNGFEIAGVLLFPIAVWLKIAALPYLFAPAHARINEGWAARFEGEEIFLAQETRKRASAEINARSYGAMLVPKIICTRAMVDELNAREIQAVVAHEMGHLKGLHHAKMITLLSLLYGVFYLMGLWFLHEYDPAQTLFLLLIGATLLRSLLLPLVNALMRNFEYEADLWAAHFCGAQFFTDTLKSVWEKSPPHEPDDMFYAYWFNAHPAREDRLINLALFGQSSPDTFGRHD